MKSSLDKLNEIAKAFSTPILTDRRIIKPQTYSPVSVQPPDDFEIYNTSSFIQDIISSHVVEVNKGIGTLIKECLRDRGVDADNTEALKGRITKINIETDPGWDHWCLDDAPLISISEPGPMEGLPEGHYGTGFKYKRYEKK